jgi:hypothetical protein
MRTVKSTRAGYNRDNEVDLLVFLGSKSFRAKNLDDSEKFQSSHDQMIKYFSHNNGLAIKVDNICDLFNSEKPASKILEDISEWTQARFHTYESAGKKIKNFFVFYIGHGQFKGATNEYYLAIRDTNDNAQLASSIFIDDLAAVIRRNAKNCRKFVFIDACYSAVASTAFQGSEIETRLKAHNESVSWEEPDIPSEGTCLFCSSSKDRVSMIGENLTQCCEALSHVFFDSEARKSHSLRSLKNECIKWLKGKYAENAVLPEVHLSETKDGDLTEVQIFRVPAKDVVQNSESTKRQRFALFEENYLEVIQQLMGKTYVASQYDNNEIKMVLSSTQVALRSVVAASYSDNLNGVNINSNIMIPYSLDDKEYSDFPGLHFHHQSRQINTYRCILKTIHWSEINTCAPMDFSLPVDKVDEELLFGAPEVFAKKRHLIVDDVKDNKEIDRLASNQSGTVKDQIKNYFARRSTFRSFCSIPLLDPINENAIGVLNVQVNKEGFFGSGIEYKNRNIKYILPISVAIACILKEVLTRRIEDGIMH